MSEVDHGRVEPIDRPLPTQPPLYDHSQGHAEHGRRLEPHTLLGVVFVLAGLAMSIWLAGLYLREGFSLTPTRLLYLLGFWILLTYVALPRLHQVLTSIYLPEYFIGRTRTSDGVLSDPINAGFDGDEIDLHVAMRRGGWVLAEERTLGSAWRMVVATVLRRSYPAAPVSDLYMMTRRHDFTYQQEVGGTTAKRHHVRFWRTPEGFVLPGGHRTDWLAAGSFDRAVGFSFFTLQVTHRIDENIDLERDYLVDTVRYADPEVPVRVVRDFSTAYHHRNGQGDRLRTDGDLPILDISGVNERSDGATAVLLPHNRRAAGPDPHAGAHDATRTALSHARERVDGIRHSTTHPREALTDQWHETFEDMRGAVLGATEHRIPPPTVLLTGAVGLVQGLVVAWLWIARALDLDVGRLLSDASALVPDPHSPALPSVVAAIALLLYIGVLLRHRWARLALMTLLSADAFVRLVAATEAGYGNVENSALVAVGASVLAVLSISSEAARQWVDSERSGRRRGPWKAAPDRAEKGRGSE